MYMLTPVVRISLRIFEKFEMTRILFLGAWGKVIHEKNQKQKISRHCPFKYSLVTFVLRKQLSSTASFLLIFLLPSRN